MRKIINISGYKFVTLYNIYTLREWLKPLCLALQLRGTITLSLEGINIGIAGEQAHIRKFIKALHSDARFAEMKFKESESEDVPFRRIAIKCKTRIVPAAVPVDPKIANDYLVSPRQLKAWLDHGEEVVLMDTRNDYEVDYGTFDGALDYRLETFNEIYETLKSHQPELEHKKVVMFCTGGIRCEKALPLAKEAGLKNVYHLEGGILKYFEECGGAHYHGGCYVFDQRIALGPDLKPIRS